jgi:2,3-dihydroxybenzoate-AMP ligase
MPDPILGERAYAYGKVARGKNLTFDELIAHLKEKGAWVLLLPETMEIRAELRLTNIGKVDKKRIREDIAENLTREVKEEK